MSVFHNDFFFLLNVAVGGDWPGFDIDDARLPVEMQVDYIRVYASDDEVGERSTYYFRHVPSRA